MNFAASSAQLTTFTVDGYNHESQSNQEKQHFLILLKDKFPILLKTLQKYKKNFCRYFLANPPSIKTG